MHIIHILRVSYIIRFHSQFLVIKRAQLVAYARVLAHVIRDRPLPQFITLQELVLLLARTLRRHGQEYGEVFDGGLHEVALEAVAEIGQGGRVGADVTPA